MKKIWAEFKDFMNQGDFVTIAVGLIIALQTVAVVNAIIEGIINPIIAAIVGKNNLSDFGFDIGDARISIGLVISALITFIAVLIILFFVLTFFAIGLGANLRRLWAEGLGKLALVYAVSLFGFVIWFGLVISLLFFHGVMPPLATPGGS